jgi:Kdo2-lipid IVA lauroyltransferase/acyltransferase
MGLTNAIRHTGRKASELAEAAGLIVVMSVFACMPVDWASAVGGRVARTIGPRLGMSRRALRNIRTALPEQDDTEHRRILRGMFDNLGRTVAEFPHMGWICAAESGRVEIVDGRGLIELKASGKPGLLFSGHFANWEVGSTVVHRLMGESLLSVYRAANNPTVNRVLRQSLRARQAVPKGTMGGRDLVRRLREGGHVGMLVDQKLNDGIAVPFFGRAAMTAPAIARLALHFHAPIVPVRIERIDGARFRFTVLSQLAASDTGDVTADVLETMTRINLIIESWIRDRPEQWLWLHRRWPD